MRNLLKPLCACMTMSCAALPPNPVDIQQARIEAQCYELAGGQLQFRTDLPPCTWQACWARRQDFCAAWPDACE